MRPTVAAVLATLLFATAAHAGDGNDTRYLELINRAHDSVRSLEVASAGSDAFQQKPLGAPLRGGGDSTTIGIAGEGCLYDLRFKFLNGRMLIYKDVDVCSGDRLAIRPLPTSDATRLVRLRPAATQYAEGDTP